MILQDVADLHAEADVSEADIASIAPGQSVDFTFDALGPDRHFAGTVLTINPASTVISGVVNYLVKATLPNIPGYQTRDDGEHDHFGRQKIRRLGRAEQRDY